MDKQTFLIYDRFERYQKLCETQLNLFLDKELHTKLANFLIKTANKVHSSAMWLPIRFGSFATTYSIPINNVTNSVFHKWHTTCWLIFIWGSY